MDDERFISSSMNPAEEETTAEEAKSTDAVEPTDSGAVEVESAEATEPVAVEGVVIEAPADAAL